MSNTDKHTEEPPGVQLAKRMLESKRQTAKETLKEYNDENSELRKGLKN